MPSLSTPKSVALLSTPPLSWPSQKPADSHLSHSPSASSSSPASRLASAAAALCTPSKLPRALDTAPAAPAAAPPTKPAARAASAAWLRSLRSVDMRERRGEGCPAGSPGGSSSWRRAERGRLGGLPAALPETPLACAAAVILHVDRRAVCRRAEEVSEAWPLLAVMS